MNDENSYRFLLLLTFIFMFGVSIVGVAYGEHSSRVYDEWLTEPAINQVYIENLVIKHFKDMAINASSMTNTSTFGVCTN